MQAEYQISWNDAGLKISSLAHGCRKSLPITPSKKKTYFQATENVQEKYFAFWFTQKNCTALREDMHSKFGCLMALIMGNFCKKK